MSIRERDSFTVLFVESGAVELVTSEEVYWQRRAKVSSYLPRFQRVPSSFAVRRLALWKATYRSAKLVQLALKYLEGAWQVAEQFASGRGTLREIFDRGQRSVAVDKNTHTQILPRSDFFLCLKNAKRIPVSTSPEPAVASPAFPELLNTTCL